MARKKVKPTLPTVVMISIARYDWPAGWQDVCLRSVFSRKAALKAVIQATRTAETSFGQDDTPAVVLAELQSNNLLRMTPITFTRFGQTRPLEA
jgi:hypothetical protein